MSHDWKDNLIGTWSVWTVGMQEKGPWAMALWRMIFEGSCILRFYAILSKSIVMSKIRAVVISTIQTTQWRKGPNVNPVGLCPTSVTLFLWNQILESIYENNWYSCRNTAKVLLPYPTEIISIYEIRYPWIPESWKPRRA